MFELLSCSLNPSSITLGGQANLTVALTAPAPVGLSVLIDLNSNGAQDTLLESPQSIAIMHGNSTATFLLQTQAVAGAATQITFTARLGNSQRSATLNIAGS